MTIYEIKQRTTKTSPYFFARNTLKFFGQTLKSFSVTRQEDKFLISAPFGSGMGNGQTQRLFNPETNKLETIKEGGES